MNCWSRILGTVLLFAVWTKWSGAVERDEVMAIIESSYNLESSSEQRIDDIIEEDPDHPLGYFLQSARLYWLQSYAGYDEALSERFEKSLKRSYKVGKRYYAGNKKDQDALFLLGMTELNMARYAIDRRRWFSASMKARSGMKRLRRLLELNPNYYDAKQPLGLANCYLDDVPVFLKIFARWLSFRGDYEAGLRQLRESKEKGFLTRYESALYIAYVSWEVKKDAETAREELHWLVERFPRNVFFQLSLAIVDRYLEDNDKAEARLLKLVEMHEIEAFIELHVQAYLQLGHYVNKDGYAERALVYAKRALQISQGEENAKPLLSLAQLFYGRVLRDLGRKEESLAAFAKIERSANPVAYRHAQVEIEKLEEGG